MAANDIAPSACIVCGKPYPSGETAPGWVYLSGAQPIGCVACSEACSDVAVDRWRATGRLDAPKARS